MQNRYLSPQIPKLSYFFPMFHVFFRLFHPWFPRPPVRSTAPALAQAGALRQGAEGRGLATLNLVQCSGVVQ